MKRLVLLFATAAIAACSAASEPTAPQLSCVPDDACGCRVVVAGGSCPGGGAHFFHELHDGAPLHFSFGNDPTAANSTRAVSDIFSPAPGDSWTETYRFEGGSVEIHYSPGPGSCPKLAQGEQCEYFDVHVQVLVRQPRGAWEYSGTGTCGC